jgi:hypothetical protein
MMKSGLMKCAGYITGTEMRNAYTVLLWKPEGKRQLWRSGYRWEDNIKMDLQDTKKFLLCLTLSHEDV